MTTVAAKEVGDQYKATLATLTFNNKLVINSLTETANQEKKFASVIVQAIEERLRKVAPEQMLPLMYLIDSICKNHGEPFKTLFQHNLVSNFAHIFQNATEKVRGMLYKLRLTWGERYNVFTDAKLFQLDTRIKKIDPAWPVSIPKNAPPPQSQTSASNKSTKIHVNPAFVGKSASVEKAVTPKPEDETEKMRAELLRKEAELIKLKQQQIDMQILEYKQMLQQKPAKENVTVDSTTGGQDVTSTKPAQTKKVESKSESKSEKKESRDPRSRDPRRKNKTDSKSKTEKATPDPPKAPSPPVIRDEEKTSTKEKDGKKSPSRKSSSSSHKSESSKSDKKSSSSSSKSSSKSSSSKSSSSSKGSSSSSKSSKEEPKENGVKVEKIDKIDKETRKRAREAEVSLSPSPTRDTKSGRISPLLPPSQGLGRIPKVRKGETPGTPVSATPDDEKKRAGKRPSGGKVSPPPDKRTKSLFIDTTDVTPQDNRDAPSPQVGWGVYKEENPDQYRTPIKEEPIFDWNPQEMEQEEGGGRPMDFRERGRGNGRFRQGGRFGRRNENRDPRMGGPGRGRGWGHQEGGRWNGRGMQPFGRGGARMPGPGMNNMGLPFNFMGGEGIGPNSLLNIPGLPPGLNLNTNDPEKIRKEVIPALIQAGEHGKQMGTINEIQFRDLMTQVMILKESSLIREQEERMRKSSAKEDKEGRRKGQQWEGSRQGLLGSPPGEERSNSDNQGKRPMSILDMPPLDRPAELGPNKSKSPHKNDLPMADASLVQQVEADPTKCLNIDDIARNIRYYGEIATIVMTDNNICELSFQPEPVERRVMVDEKMPIFCMINNPNYTEFCLDDGSKHMLKIGPPTRELWVNGDWYECYFDSTVPVMINNQVHSVFLPGPPPIVKIGEPRSDLCLGRVYALTDGNLMDKVAIYLDQKPQLISIADKPHILQFVEGFRTLTINGHPFRADFGGFPMVISVQGKKHYLRLTSLPNGVVLPEPGQQSGSNITEKKQDRKNAVRGRNSPVMVIGGSPKQGRNSPVQGRVSPIEEKPVSPPQEWKSPEKDPVISVKNQESLMLAVPGPSPISLSPRPELEPRLSPTPDIKEPTVGPASPPQDEMSQDGVGLGKQDPLNSLMSLFPLPNAESNPPPTPGTNYASVDGPPGPPAPPPALVPAPSAVPAPPPTDVNALLASLLKIGMISGNNGQPEDRGIPGLTTLPTQDTQPPQVPDIPVVKPPPVLVQPPPTMDVPRVRQASVTIHPLVLKSHHHSLKERQFGIVELLYGREDLQCKSCGVRYTREEMGQYTAHLDWHFRVKRREKDNARRAQSRKWYFEKRDWIVCDEIEDLEHDEDLDEEEENIIIPTLPVGDKKTLEKCPVCMEEFDQFYKQGENDEEGGWYVHNAVLEDGVVFHPECLKDKDKGLDISTADSSVNEALESMDTEEKVVEDVTVKSEEVEMKEESKEVSVDEPNSISVKAEESSEVNPERVPSPDLKDVKVESDKEGKTTDNNDNNVDMKDDSAVKDENSEETPDSSEVVTEEPSKEEAGSANASLLEEGSNLSVPVIGSQKVDIKMSFTSKPEPVERRESMMSSQSEQEETEFDPEAVIVPAPTDEAKDIQKPRLKGRRLTVMPARDMDTDLSGLCSIM